MWSWRSRAVASLSALSVLLASVAAGSAGLADGTAEVSADSVDTEGEREHRAQFSSEHADHGNMHATMLLVLLGTVALSQTGLLLWRKMRPRSYQIASLLGLWLVPALLALSVPNWRFCAIWLVFSIANGVVVRLARQQPLQRDTPRIVYWWFYGMYLICYQLGMAAYSAILVMIMVLARFFTVETTAAIFHAIILLLFYATYFGILIRDIAEGCADFISSGLGFCNADGIPMRATGDFSCGICASALSDGDKSALSKRERPITLECSHRFHYWCICGWCIVGKKNTCPTCKEKVDLRAVPQAEWMSVNILYAQALDFMRYLFVWQPLILMLATFINQSLGLW